MVNLGQSYDVAGKTCYNIVAEITGDKQAKEIGKMKLIHDNAYVLTVVAVVACLMQYMEGSICRPGLWFQANLVVPTQFFSDIKRLGVEISVKESIVES